MYNTYTEMAALKELFTKKFDPERLYDCIMNTKSGCLLNFFSIQQLEKLSHSQIMKVMSKFKSDVIRAYNRQTKNKVLQGILDYCYDSGMKPEKVMVSAKDLDWFVSADDCDAIKVHEVLTKDRFELTANAKEMLLKKCHNISQIKLFSKYLSDKDLFKHYNENPYLVLLMKKPTLEMIKAWYKEHWSRLDEVAVLDSYPIDFVVELIENRAITKDILSVAEKQYGKLVEIYKRLVQNNSYDDNYLIEEYGDEELKNFTSLSNNNRELIKQYVRERLLDTK